MGKRGRRSKVDEEEVSLGSYFTKIGLAEVDRIINGRQFQNFANSTSSIRRTVAEVDRMVEGHKFRKLSAHSSPGRSTSKVNHFSRMPDEILHRIISLLTMREAAATTILSTQWRNLWTTSVSCLNFDIPNMLGYDYPTDKFKNRSTRFLMKKKFNFISWVDGVMQLCLASRLDALRVSFILDKDSASHIDSWIMSAVAQGVTDIQLDFHMEKFWGLIIDPCMGYEFPVQQVASSLKHLQLKFCSFHLPPNFTGFTSLISLSLSFVSVTESLMDDILSKCPLLEFLSLEYCSFPNPTNFKFSGPSLLLKHLHIGLTRGIKKIEVHDINLLSFELGEPVQKLSIKNAPHLARLVLQMWIPIETLSNVPRLETLFLARPFRKISIPPQLLFKNLKRLVLIASMSEANLLGVVDILKACHLLQELELDMGITERRNNMHDKMVKKFTALPESPHKNLKKIEIYGFQAYPERIELAKYLLINAIVLQKMELYTTTKVYVKNGEWELYEGTPEPAISLMEARKLLQNVAQSATELELFSSFNL